MTSWEVPSAPALLAHKGEMEPEGATSSVAHRPIWRIAALDSRSVSHLVEGFPALIVITPFVREILLGDILLLLHSKVA